MKSSRAKISILRSINIPETNFIFGGFMIQTKQGFIGEIGEKISFSKGERKKSL